MKVPVTFCFVPRTWPWQEISLIHGWNAAYVYVYMCMLTSGNFPRFPDSAKKNYGRISALLQKIGIGVLLLLISAWFLRVFLWQENSFIPEMSLLCARLVWLDNLLALLRKIGRYPSSTSTSFLETPTYECNNCWCIYSKTSLNWLTIGPILNGPFKEVADLKI